MEKLMVVVISAFLGLLALIASSVTKLNGDTLDAIYWLLASFYLFYQANSLSKDVKDDEN